MENDLRVKRKSANIVNVNIWYKIEKVKTVGPKWEREDGGYFCDKCDYKAAQENFLIHHKKGKHEKYWEIYEKYWGIYEKYWE